jgi:hypothetical protein
MPLRYAANYIIGNDGISLCREPPAAVNEGEIVVTSNEELQAAALRERLNKGLEHGRGALRLAHRPLYGIIGVCWGRIGRPHSLPAWLRTHYAPWQHNRWRRPMNRLASAQVTRRRWVFFFSPR